MNKTAILIGSGILAALSGTMLYVHFKPDPKAKLVDQILNKYAGDPNFEGTRDSLMRYDINTLKGVLAGTIR